MFRPALALALVSAFALSASAAENAAPGQSCATRAKVLQHLSHKYSEAPIAIGLAENGGVIEVLTSGQGGTWTIIITMPDGTSCMVAAGEDWEQLPKFAAKSPGL
jgi:hypothetical protein